MVSEIYCYGGIDIYRDVFNAIAMLNGDRSFIQSLVTIGVIVGAFWSMVIMVGGDFVKPFLSWMIPMTIIQTVFLTPTKTVHLIDVVQAGRHETVDNVPYGLALMAGTLSRISHKLTEKTETFFTIPGDLKYSQTGGIFAANLLSNQKIMTIHDEDFAENMRSFIGQCVLYDLALGRKYTIKDLRNTNNIWGLISANASPARSFLWKDNRNRGEIITCQEGVTRFTQAWSGAIDQSACAVGASLYPNKDATPMSLLGGGGAGEGNGVGVCRSPLAKQEFLRFLPIHYGVMASLSGNAGETLKQQMMISSMVDAQDQASVMAGNASNFAARKAYLQQRSNYETIGKLASDTLPIMRAVLELICYSIFIFIMPLLVLPQGYKVLVSWSQTILWLSMWPPMYAILHLIMVSAISMKTKAFIGISNPHGITIASSLGAQNISADMATMAGYLSMSIPFICIAIVKGISSFVHMSSSLGAVSQGAATGASTEALTGNHQIGNTSMDNHSFNNVNMLSENYSGNVSSGNMRMQDGHVSITSSADGGAVASIEQSNLPISVNMAENIAQSKRMAALQEMSTGQSHMQSAETSLGSSVEQIGNLGRTLSNSTNIQKGWNESEQQQVAKSFQKLESAVNKFAEMNNISTGKAAQVMANAGLNIFGMGGGMSTTSSSEDTSLIEKAKDFSKSESLEESARIAHDATRHLSKIDTNDDVKSYLESHQASLSKAERESDSAQKHLERSQRLSNEADIVTSQSGTINRNMNDQFKEWLSKQDAPLVGGKIGMRGALGIIANSNNQNETVLYAQQFMQEQMPKMSLGMSESALESNYQKETVSSVVNKSSVNSFSQQASSEIKHDLKNKTEGMESRFDEKVNTTQAMFNAEKINMVNQSTQVEQRYHEDKDKVGIKEATMQGISATLNANKEMAHAMKDTASATLQFVSDHSEIALAANPLMFSHPSLTQGTTRQNQQTYNAPEKQFVSEIEPQQKVVKIKQFVKEAETESLDSKVNNKKDVLVGNG
jgi:conjugal transfer mating pair stabilization protein TraG